MQTPFIRKMINILEENQYPEIVGWTWNKTAIEIRDQDKFERQILPKYFRHARMTSFIRQLNLYGFQKMRNSNYQSYTHPELESGKSLSQILCVKKMKKLENRPEGVYSQKHQKNKAKRDSEEERIRQNRNRQNFENQDNQQNQQNEENQRREAGRMQLSNGGVNEPQNFMNRVSYYWYNPQNMGSVPYIGNFFCTYLPM